MTLTEKTAYIKGLVEGLELNADEKEVKVINAIIGLLDDMALTVSDLEESMNDMGNQLDEVDEDLYYLEQDFYDEDEDDGEDEEYYEVTCPTCNETICVSEDVLLKGGIQCPNCGESLEFDFDDLECDCGCCSDADDEDYCGCGCGEQVEEPIKSKQLSSFSQLSLCYRQLIRKRLLCKILKAV